MTRLVTNPRFRFDTAEILNYLEEVAGPHVAARYSRRFDEAIMRLTDFPESGAPRAALGAGTRIVIIQSYLLIYDYVRDDDTLTLLRILHGRRNISRAVL
jgi:toxin ParE1/3/4